MPLERMDQAAPLRHTRPDLGMDPSLPYRQNTESCCRRSNLRSRPSSQRSAPGKRSGTDPLPCLHQRPTPYSLLQDQAFRR
ncbi:hypothetical protein DPMN_004337 [Dreissena polymorpha]|uniref:Uncharacterized protein n=1 Tax=Dreissena polymorpha TaxID=45954 RepID=A0A9D4RVK9_DREPO|nr:hypothetical protein DPMN_004337 [Dreissena polymorpha]